MHRKYLIPVLIAATVVLLLIGGCKVGPNYSRPEADVGQRYRFDSAGDTNTIAAIEWTKLFRDTVLQRLIRTGLANNFDMLVAYSRIDQAMASFKIARAQVWPMISATGNAAANRMSSGSSGTVLEYQSYTATAGLTWELDIWGKLRRAKESERAKLMASRAYQQSVLITLVADIAITYFNILEFDNELAITKDNIQIREQSLELVRAKMIAGTASGLVVAQAEAELAYTKTQVPALEMQIGMAENALSILIGALPGPILRGRPMLDQIEYPEILSPGIPSQLILNRPDVIEVEQMLVSANADIGVARASMLPTLGITADIGTAFNTTNLVYSLVGNLTAPIWGQGRLRGNLRKAQAYREEMTFTYLKTIYTSLQETSDALLEVKKQKEVTLSQKDLVAAAQTNFDLSNQLYNAGYASYLDVLDAQRRLFSAQINLSQSQNNELDAFVSLYKALGGGWK